MKLKSAIAIFTALPVIAFGQVNTQVCYEATSSGYGKIPKELCLISMKESSSATNLLEVYSGDINMPETLKVTSMINHNEDRLRFKAENVISEDWNGGCEAGFISTLKVAGQLNYGSIDVKDLKIAVEIQTTNDTCHSPVDTETIEYKLK
jgi:hypothetical protein